MRGRDVTFHRTCHAELIKLVTLPVMWITTVGTLGLSYVVARALISNTGDLSNPSDLIRQVPSYTMVGVVIGGVLIANSEYATRQVARSLTCVPNRTLLLVAKAAATALWAAVVGLGVMVLAWLAMSPDSIAGFGNVLLGTNLHFIAMTLIACALAMLLRSLAAALPTALVLLVVAPPFLLNLSSWARWLPSLAGEQLFTSPSQRMVGLFAAGGTLAAWTLVIWFGASRRFSSDA